MSRPMGAWFAPVFALALWAFVRSSRVSSRARWASARHGADAAGGALAIGVLLLSALVPAGYSLALARRQDHDG
jgi:hypothetical protein